MTAQERQCCFDKTRSGFWLSEKPIAGARPSQAHLAEATSRKPGKTRVQTLARRRSRYRNRSRKRCANRPSVRKNNQHFPACTPAIPDENSTSAVTNVDEFRPAEIGVQDYRHYWEYRGTQAAKLCVQARDTVPALITASRLTENEAQSHVWKLRCELQKHGAAVETQREVEQALAVFWAYRAIQRYANCEVSLNVH